MTLTSSSHAAEASALCCCECALPVGTEGAARAVLLLPCQHVMHQTCVEYQKRMTRANSAHGGDDSDSDATAAAAARPPFFSPERPLLCRACGEAVARFVPLYSLVQADAAEAGAGRGLAAGVAAVVHAQKKTLRRMREFRERQREAAALTRSCAAVYEQCAAHRAAFNKASRVLAEAAAEERRAGDGRERLSEGPVAIAAMSLRELRAYVEAKTAQLADARESLRRQRHATARCERRHKAAREELHAMHRDAAAAEGATHHGKRSRSPAGSGDDDDAREEAERARLLRRREMWRRQRTLDLARDAAPPQAPSTAAAEVPAAVVPVDVDTDSSGAEGGGELTGGASADAPLVITDSDDGEEDDVVVARAGASGSHSHSRPPAGSSTRASGGPSPATHGWSAAGGVAAGSVHYAPYGDDGSGDSGTAEEAEEPLLLVPTRRASAQEPSYLRRHLQLLPKREDRLFQSSLTQSHH